MKPIFTIHAGEYLVASEIEQRFRDYFVWLPSKDTGIDLLVTNNDNTRTASLQVKFSKDFNATHVRDAFRPNIRGTGWWTLNRQKIVDSNADFWVFILYSFENRNQDYIIITPEELLSIFDNTNRFTDKIHCYITVTNNSTAFETRGLNENQMNSIFDNSFPVDNIRCLNNYLNNWTPMINKLNI